MPIGHEIFAEMVVRVAETTLDSWEHSPGLIWIQKDIEVRVLSVEETNTTGTSAQKENKVIDTLRNLHGRGIRHAHRVYKQAKNHRLHHKISSTTVNTTLSY